MYLPKSKYSLKQASKGKFVYAYTGKPFEGTYLHLSDGNMFAGNQIHQISNEDRIIPKIQEKKDNTYILNKEPDSRYYNFTKKGKKVSKEQDKLEPIYPTKPTPTSEDYVKGFFYRYFAKRKNSTTIYYEINKEIHEDLKSKGGKYDYVLFLSEKIRWDLTDDARKNNRSTIRNLIKKNTKSNYRYLTKLFFDYEEYQLRNDVLRPKNDPKNINAPKPKLSLQIRRNKVIEAQRGAIDIIKEKARKKYNKSSGGMGSTTTPTSTPTSTPSGGGGGGY